MTTLADLAAQIEAEPPNYSLWADAWVLVQEYRYDDDRWRTFDRYLRMEAWLSAAAMLMSPPWLVFDVCQDFDDGAFDVMLYVDRTNITVSGRASGPHAEARARLAAALRAIATARKGRRRVRRLPV